MLLAHFGVAVFVVGVTLVKGYETERDVRMSVGDTLTMGAYVFRFDGVTETTGPNYKASRAIFDVSKNGKHDTTITLQGDSEQVSRARTFRGVRDSGARAGAARPHQHARGPRVRGQLRNPNPDGPDTRKE